jgi:hypothetical protein
MDVNEVMSSLAGQVECYRRLARLAELQHECVQTGQTQSLLEVLGRRQEELDRVAQLETATHRGSQTWKAWIASLEGEVRTRAEKMLEEMKRLLETITVADRRDSIVLQQRKLTIGREMHQAKSAAATSRKYAAAAYGRPAPRMDVMR